MQVLGGIRHTPGVQKQKNFSRCKFSPEVLLAALQVGAVDGQRRFRKPATMSVRTAGGDAWNFDNEDEFLAEYRRPCIYADYGSYSDGASLTLQYYGQGLGMSTSVTVQGGSRGEIEAVMAVFEHHAAASTVPLPPAPPAPLPPAPRVFIGHGRAPDWRDLKDHLREQHGYRVEAYETGTRTGHTIRDVLDKMLGRANFAVLVLTGEDELNDGQMRPRENVVHETGLFQGRLGWTRAIMLVEEGVEPFSNIAGIQQLRYEKGQIRSTFGDVLASLKAEFGPGPFAP